MLLSPDSANQVCNLICPTSRTQSWKIFDTKPIFEFSHTKPAAPIFVEWQQYMWQQYLWQQYLWQQYLRIVKHCNVSDIKLEMMERKARSVANPSIRKMKEHFARCKRFHCPVTDTTHPDDTKAFYLFPKMCRCVTLCQNLVQILDGSRSLENISSNVFWKCIIRF